MWRPKHVGVCVCVCPLAYVYISLMLSIISMIMFPSYFCMTVLTVASVGPCLITGADKVVCSLSRPECDTDRHKTGCIWSKSIAIATVAHAHNLQLNMSTFH